jgi:nucleotide-binding universal stress UspA family protein
MHLLNGIVQLRSDKMKILLAIDGSPHSHAALVEFATRPWPNGTEVQILTVVHSSIPLIFDPAFFLAAAHMEQTLDRRRDAPTLVEAAATMVRNAHPNVSVTTKINEGIPQDVIVEEAQSWRADLIVLGSHGYGRMRRVVLGSVAAAVVAKAPCSVQVVCAKHVLAKEESAA